MLFYECDGSEGYLIEKSIAELQMEDMEPHQAEIERMRQGLHSFHWIHDELCFRGLQLQLKQLQLSVPKLHAAAVWLYSGLESVVSSDYASGHRFT